MHYRRNIDCLGTEELHDLREALAAMYALPAADPNSFATLAGFHGGPPTGFCRHGAPGFFTWHRAYMVAFEKALSAFGCQVALPFWDWSSGPSTGVPAACRFPTYVNRSGATVPNPLFSGPRAAGGQTNRRADIDTTAFDDLATSAQAAMSATTFSSFQNQINGVHGSVHVRTGGDMQSVPTAAFDPIFYLHHANIDRLWAQWQASHPGPLPAAEATSQLEPFNRPFSIQWQTGADVESTAALGYRYRRFCYFFPPIRIWEVAVLPFPWDIRKQMESARLLIRTPRMQEQPVEIRAFLDMEKATDRSKTIDNPAFAGSVGFLGHQGRRHDAGPADGCDECKRLGHHDNHGPHDHGPHDHGHDRPVDATEKERFDVELDLTAALRGLDPDTDEVTLKLVAVGAGGDRLAAEQISIGEIEVVID